MSKYLLKKIEAAHSAYFEELIFIPSECHRPSPSETFQELQELELKEIIKIFDFSDSKDAQKLLSNVIKNKEFSTLLLDNYRSGFIAKCHIPEHSNFHFKEGSNTPSRCSIHYSIQNVFWVYADSIYELVEKMKLKSEDMYKEFYESERNNSTKK